MSLKLKFFIFFVTFIGSLWGQSDTELPMTSQPLEYLLIITTAVPGPARRFQGTLSLKTRVLQDTHEIFLHSKDHTINDLKVMFRGSDFAGSVSHTKENDDVIKITCENELKAGSIYELLIIYQGNLLLSSDGLFRSSYVTRDEITGNDVFT